MRVDEHIDRLADEGRRLVALIEEADPAAVVPTCPEWTVADLARHVGQVHRWAAAIVRDGRTTPMDDDAQRAVWGPPPADADLARWLADGHATVVEALRDAPDDLECWAFLSAPSPRAFWARRQHHETAIHRIDAQRAVRPDLVDDAVPVASAVDGVDELLLAFFSRPRNRVRTPQPRTMAVVAADGDAAWRVTTGPDGARGERIDPADADGADAAVRAPAATLYSGLWNRAPLDITGDPGMARLWPDLARVRWS